MSASPFFTLLCTPWGKGGGTADGVGHNDYVSLVSVMVMMMTMVMVMMMMMMMTMLMMTTTTTTTMRMMI